MTTRKKPAAKSAEKPASAAKKPSRSRNPKPPAKPVGATTAKSAARPAPVGPRPGVPAPDHAPRPPAPVVKDGGDAPGLELKKQELIAKVVDRADVKKKYAKPVIEAMIEVLGEALAEGREWNLQPLGKLKHNRTKETASARIIVAKIRQKKEGASKGPGDAKESVADAAE